MSSIREQVIADFIPAIEREIKYRTLVKRLVELGCPEEEDYEDIAIFLPCIATLNDTLDSVEKLRELMEIVKDSEFLFGKASECMVKYLMYC